MHQKFDVFFTLSDIGLHNKNKCYTIKALMYAKKNLKTSFNRFKKNFKCVEKSSRF